MVIGKASEPEDKEDGMWLVIGIVLVVFWAFSFVVFKVTSWALHLLILFAAIAGVMQLVRWFRERRSRP